MITENTCTPAQNTVQTEKERTIEFLKERFVKPGCTIYTILRHVTTEGTTRFFDVYCVKDNEPYRITHSVAEVTGYKYNKHWEAIRIPGYGFCAEDEIAETLSRALFGNPSAITGRRI
jgi:hypothetical protein